MGLKHPVAIVILLTVRITLTLMLATDTKSTLVGAHVCLLVSCHLAATAITLYVPITITMDYAIRTVDTWATPVIAEGCDRHLDSAIPSATTETLTADVVRVIPDSLAGKRRKMAYLAILKNREK